jgi:DNA-binding response OmpR family regulator
MDAALLLVDTEPETRGFLERHLPEDGFALVERSPDLVLAGVEEIERWRERAPVIVLGPEGADAVDRVHAFRRGCDDYLAPPFDYAELVERIRAVLRRARPEPVEIIRAGPVEIDVAAREVRVGGRRAILSVKEYELLMALARDPVRVWTRGELLRDVWDYPASARTRTLDSHASRLRRKLWSPEAETELVENVWGVGYRLLGSFPPT